VTLNERLMELARGEREVAAGMDADPLHTANGQYAQTADDARARIAELEAALDEIHGAGYAMFRGANGGVTRMCVPIDAWGNAMKARKK
jgi:DNA-binding IclR family transcriptional regulator